jgi:Spy/CpxP family protein refolding chaperone
MKLSTLSLAGLLLLAIFTMATTVLAEDPPRGQPRDKALLMEQLELSDEQTLQFQSLIEKHHGERRAMQKGDREKRHEMHQRQRSEMAEVLSEEQMRALETSRPKRPRRK